MNMLEHFLYINFVFYSFSFNSAILLYKKIYSMQVATLLLSEQTYQTPYKYKYIYMHIYIIYIPAQEIDVLRCTRENIKFKYSRLSMCIFIVVQLKSIPLECIFFRFDMCVCFLLYRYRGR